MFEEFETFIKKAIGAALKAVGKRFEPFEADVKALKTDVASFKSFVEGMQSSTAVDLTAVLPDFGSTGHRQRRRREQRQHRR